MNTTAHSPRKKMPGGVGPTGRRDEGTSVGGSVVRSVEVDSDFERALIGLALNNPDVAEKLIADGVRPDWFHEPTHRRIFGALRHAKHRAIIETKEILTQDRDPAADQLFGIADCACPESQLGWHVERLKAAHCQRALADLGRELTERATEGDPADVIEAVRDQLDVIERAGSVIAADGRSLSDFVSMQIDLEETLLGNRYLCRGGSMLFVGPSGIGKSSASCQQDMLWSVGREAFGIRPARPLRILTFQAENDDGDQHEMARGVMSGLRLTKDEMLTVAANTRYLTRFETGQSFLRMMAREVDRWKPDLVRLDPLNAYIGDDAKEPRAIAEFCRSGINPVLYRHRCGCVVAHHTPKTNFRDTSNWSALDWAYAGAGGADLTNWARAVLVVDPVNLEQGLFRIIGAKRGARIGWRNDADQRVIERYFCYSREPGLIYWREPGEDEVIEARRADAKVGRTPDDLLEYVPPEGELTGKATLLQHAQKALVIGQKKSEAFLKSLIERGLVYEHREKRKNKRDGIFIGRHAPKAEVQP